MCLGSHQGLRSLAFCFLVLSQQIWAFAPAGIQAGFEASVAAGLIDNGVAEQSAREQAREVSEWAFGNEESGRKGRYSDPIDNKKLSIKELFSQGVVEHLNFETLTGEEGVLYNVYKNGTSQDRMTLEHLYKEVLPDSKGLFFKTERRKGAVLDKLTHLDQYDTFFAIAPEWFGSTGAAMYRSAYKVNQDDDYLYANSPEAMMYGFYHFTNHNFDDKKIVVDLGHSKQLGKNAKATVFSEIFAFCEGTAYSCDIAGNSSFEFPIDSFTRGTLKSIYVRILGETTPRDVELLTEQIREEFKEPVENDEGEVIDYVYVPYDVNELAKAINEHTDNSMDHDNPRSYVQPFEAMIVKLRDDVLSEDSLKLQQNASRDEKIDTFSTPDGISEKEADDFILKSESMKQLYNGILKGYRQHTVASQSGGGGTSQSIPKSSLDLFASDNFFKSSDFDSMPRPSFSSFGERKEMGYEGMTDPAAGTQTISYEQFNESGATPPDREKDRERPIPAGGTGTVLDPLSGSNNTGIGSGRGSTSGNTAGDSTGSGVGSGSSAETGTSAVTGAGSLSGAGSLTGSRTKEKEVAENLDAPSLLDITGKEILQPLLDLKDNLLEGLTFSNVSGTCPTATFEAFQRSYNIEAHCIVFDKVSGAISAVMLAIWAILGFRIVFSA